MTDSEIIKALECCKNADCLNCPRWSGEWHSGMCNTFLSEVLNLINRQKAEIERLSHKCDDCAGCTQWVCDCGIIEAEAVKEFAEKLCEGRVSNDPVVIVVKAELKEMVGEKK